MLSRDHHGPRAVLNAVQRIAEAYGSEAARAPENLAMAEGQLTAYGERIGMPFQHAEYLSELTRLRDELKAGLAGGEPKEGEPSVAELAEKIKTLRSTNTAWRPRRSGRRSGRRRAQEPAATVIWRREHEADGEGEWGLRAFCVIRFRLFSFWPYNS